MREFVEYLVTHLVDSPDSVRVAQVESARTTIFEISVADGDVGKIIGKHGQTANAIRILLTAVSVKNGGKRALFEINDYHHSH